MFLCNISNVDDAVDRKVVEAKKYSMVRSCIGTSPIFKPSNIIADHSRKTVEERADLCLESKTKFFFEKHTESSDAGELLEIAQNVSETKGNFDQNQLMLDIEKVLRDCEMDRENFKFM